jgi:hypothetical protein
MDKIFHICGFIAMVVLKSSDPTNRHIVRHDVVDIFNLMYKDEWLGPGWEPGYTGIPAYCLLLPLTS